MPLIAYKPFPRFLRHCWFRLWNGFWPSETWSLDHSLVEWLLPRLKYFRAVHAGFPGSLTELEWNGILDRMIEGLELKLKEWEPGHLTPEEGQKVADAFYYLGTWGEHLWD